VLERIDDVGADAEQTELEHLEKPAGTCADDDGFGDDRRRGGRGVGGVGQRKTFAVIDLRQCIVVAPRARCSHRAAPRADAPAAGVAV